MASLSAAMRIALLLTANTNGLSAAMERADRMVSAKFKKWEKSGKVLEGIGENMMKSGARDMVVGGAALAPLGMLINQASEFEDKMIDIRKQMAVDNPAAVQKMTDSIFKMARTMPIATGEIQDLIASGLRMGVAESQVKDFSLQVTKMAVAFDLPAGEIVDKMAGIAKVFKIPIEQIGGFADSINYLDDNTLAKGNDLIELLARIGGTSKYLNKNSAAALASTMLTLQETPERAGTAISGMINTLAAAGSQSKASRAMMGALGFNPEQLQKDMVNDAQATINKVLQAISSQTPDKQQSFLYKIFGSERVPALNKLVTNMGEYRRQLEMLESGKQSGSMDAEYSKRLQSFSAQYQIAKNRASELGVTLGAKLMPMAVKLMEKIIPLVDKLIAFTNAHPELTKNILKAVAAFGAMKIGVGALKIAFGGTFKTLGQLIGAPAKFKRNWGLMKDTVDTVRLKFWYFKDGVTKVAKIVSGNFMKMATGIGRAISVVSKILMANPWMLAIAGIILVVALIYRNWDKIKAWFIKLWASVKKIFTRTWEGIKSMFLNYTPYGLIYKHWDSISAYFKALWDKVKNAFNAAWNWIKGIATGMFESGQSFVSNLWKGISSKVEWLVSKVKGVAGKIRDFFPFSPAKTGPLKDIHKIKLMETVAMTIKPAPVLNAMNNAIKPIAAAGGAKAGSGAAGGMTVHFAPVINLSGTATQNDANTITATLKKEFAKMMQEYQRNTARVGFA